MNAHTPPTLLERIDEKIEADHAAEEPFRNHLGGSMIGKPCERQLYYNFRWATRPTFKARMLRLFDRGHKEEFRFVDYLRSAGVNVREYSQRLVYNSHFDGGEPYRLIDWDAPFGQDDGIGQDVDVTGDPVHVAAATQRGVKPQQWRISDVMGHFGGSLDGESDAPFDIYDYLGNRIPAGEEFLNEFKTHNTKSFCDLVKEKSVRKSKVVHWAQMQIYMHKRGLKWALYMAVNKNDDDLYLEIVAYDPAEGPRLLAIAERVIAAKSAPNRIGKHPSWFDCKFCSDAKVCHYGEAPERHCRSCRHAEAVEGAQWKCNKFGQIIPGDFIRKGCDNYQAITD